jgi:hypothetical protein
MEPLGSEGLICFNTLSLMHTLLLIGLMPLVYDDRNVLTN